MLPPTQQVAFAVRLEQIRSQYLDVALQGTIGQETFNLAVLDDELARLVRPDCLKSLAKSGIRGERFFPAPYLLQTNPYLLGYYRLQYGFSQKQFYLSGTPFSDFRRLEVDGVIPDGLAGHLPALCESLIESGCLLVDGLGLVSLSLVRDLQFLTVGAQLRGSRNTELGKVATDVVFNHLKSLIDPRYIQHEQARCRP